MGRKTNKEKNTKNLNACVSETETMSNENQYRNSALSLLLENEH